MKKLQLNKKTVASLENPEKIYGGEAYTYAGTHPEGNSACESVCVTCMVNGVWKQLHTNPYCGIQH